MARARLSQNIVTNATNALVSALYSLLGSLLSAQKVLLCLVIFSCFTSALNAEEIMAVDEVLELEPAAQDLGPLQLSPETKSDAQTELDDAGLVAEQPEAEPWWGWLVGRRYAFSRGFTSMAESIDRFFAGTEQLPALENESYFKLTLGGTQFKAGRFVFANRVKIKLDLPGTQHKWKLVFSSDDEQDRDLAEQVSEVATEQELIADSGATGAFRYVISEYKRWKLDTDLGIKTPFPVDPFIRLRARRSFDLDNAWKARLSQQFYYYHRRHFISDTRYSVEKALTQEYFVRNTLRARFNDAEDNWEFAETLSTYHILNEDYVIDYNVGVVAFSQPDPKVDTFFINTKLRRRLYEDWLFVDFQPGISFPRENDYKISPSFGIRLEVLLCHNSKL